MLKLNLSPVRSHETQPVVSWQAPVLTIGAMDYDLSLLEDGATAQHPILGTVTRAGNDYECTIRLTHGANAPEETRFPSPIEVTEDGEIALPPYDNEPLSEDGELIA